TQKLDKPLSKRGHHRHEDDIVPVNAARNERTTDRGGVESEFATTQGVQYRRRLFQLLVYSSSGAINLCCQPGLEIAVVLQETIADTLGETAVVETGGDVRPQTVIVGVTRRFFAQEIDPAVERVFEDGQLRPAGSVGPAEGLAPCDLEYSIGRSQNVERA